MSRGAASTNCDFPHKAEDLRKIPLLAQCSDDCLTQIFHMASRHEVKLRRRLDCTNEQIAFVWSGRFSRRTSTYAGVEPAGDSYGPGGVFGLILTLMKPPGLSLELVAVASGGLLLVPAEKFLSLADATPALNRAIMKQLADEATQALARLFEMTHLDVKARVQVLLLRLAQDAGGEDDARIIRGAPTHAAIADQIGATREGVTRSLGSLTDEGLIRTKRGIIEIPSLLRLAQSKDAAARRYFMRYISNP